MKSLLIKILIAPLVLLGSLFHQKEVPQTPIETVSKVQVQKLISDALAGQTATFGVTGTLPINGSTYNLSGSGVTSSATSFTLSSLTIPQNGYKIVDADASATFYMTLEPGSRTRQEVVACTTIAQNVAGTATISGCTRGMSPISPYTASTSLKFAHPGGSQVIFGDAAQLFNEYAALGNDQTITAVWTFDDNDSFRPRIDADTDTAVSTAFVTLGQLSRQAISGASNGSETTKGIFEGATAIEQASSTSAGSTSALLVNLALYSTSTPVRGCNGTSVVGALCNVIARNNGTIHPNFIGTTTADIYHWGGLSFFDGGLFASSTNNVIASSTMFNFNIGNIIATSSIKFTNGLTNMASSSILQADTAGNLTYGSPQFSYLNYPSVAAGASSTLLYFTVPANSLGTNGFIEVTIPFRSFAHQSVADFFEMSFGNSTSTATLPYTAGSGSKAGTVHIVLGGNGATNSQNLTFDILGTLEGNNTTTETLSYQVSFSKSIDQTVNRVFMVVIKTQGGVNFTPNQVTAVLHRN